MKITFPGVGSAFSKEHLNSMAVLEIKETTDVGAVYIRRLMMDCGRTAPEAIAAVGLNWGEIDAVFVTHGHSDHAGGLEEFAFTRKFVFKDRKKPILLAESKTLDFLWNNTLKGGLGFDQKEPLNPDYFWLSEYFDPQIIDKGVTLFGQEFMFERNQHIMYSYGLKFQTPVHHVYISGDSLMKSAHFYEEFDVIFHDAEITKYHSGVHAHYEELCTLPAKIKKKMYLYHYQDGPRPVAVADGFAGFVKKGQSFEL